MLFFRRHLSSMQLISGIGHSTGSSWIQGKELLGMKPEIRDETYPLFKRVSVPRMILAQFDSINYTRILTKYGKFVLTELESLMSRNQPEYFFLVYVCLFVLLREASSTSADRYRHARNNHGQSVSDLQHVPHQPPIYLW